MRTAAHCLVYLVARAAWAVLALVPLALLRPALEGVAGLVMRLDGRHRAIVADNLGAAFPEWSDVEVERGVREAFRNWGRIGAELLRAREVMAAADTAWVDEAEDVRRRLVAEGRGVLVLTAHTGNFELLARIWGRASAEVVTVFHRPMSNRFVDAFLLRQRAAANVQTLGRGSEVRAAMRVLAAGGVLAVPLDQNQPPGRPGVFVDLFGRPAATATSLARLSLASGAAVLPVFAAWEAGRPVAIVGRPLRPDGAAGSAGRDEALRRLTQAYTREIEAVVRRYPYQWNWAHRRWKTRPDK